MPMSPDFSIYGARFPTKGRGSCCGLFFKLREGFPLLILLAFIHIAGLFVHMPICTDNVKKRKARRIKNDRLQAAKKAAKAKA